MKRVAILLGLWPALAGAETAPPAQATPAVQTVDAQDYAYCSAFAATLRELDPGMLAGVAPGAEAALRAKAAELSPQWQLGVGLKPAEMRGAADARRLMNQPGMMEQMSGKRETIDAGTAWARCWTLVQPYMTRPTRVRAPAPSTPKPAPTAPASTTP